MKNSESTLGTHVHIITNKITLFKLLHKCFGWEFYSVGILKFITDSTSFMGPLLLNKLIGFIEDKNEPIMYGYLYASLIFVSALIGELINKSNQFVISNICWNLLIIILFYLGAFCNTHFTFWMSVVGLKIRSTVVTLLYRKILHSSNVQLKQQFNFGEIVNFMTTDNDRVVNSCASFHAFWSIPLQVILYYIIF